MEYQPMLAREGALLVIGSLFDFKIKRETVIAVGFRWIRRD
jgi:hypothetical protein